MTPKVAVLLSSFNGEDYVREQIDSILSQTGVEIHLVCRDDGSSDDTPEILKEYCSKYPDNMTILASEGNKGFARSFEILMDYARTMPYAPDVFAFADQDDVWKPEKMRVAAETIMAHPADAPTLYCSNVELVDSDLNHISTPRGISRRHCTKHRSLIRNLAPGCTMAFNRTALELYLDNPVRDNKLHDKLMLQICSFLGRVIYDNTPHILYRQHHSNQIGSPGLTGRMKRRMQGHYKEHCIENADRAFLNAFGHLLSEKDIKLVRIVTDYRKSWFKRVMLILNPRLKHDTLERNFFLILKILLGTL